VSYYYNEVHRSLRHNIQYISWSLSKLFMEDNFLKLFIRPRLEFNLSSSKCVQLNTLIRFLWEIVAFTFT